MRHLAHGGERRVAGCIQILNQQLDTVWDHAKKGQKKTNKQTHPLSSPLSI